MFETGRRSAISSSELGLYSDRADRYSRNKYGPVVRKFVIGLMAIVAAILAAIFIYDFASGASASSKVSQETKHIYMLQNALKKPMKTTTTPIPKPEVDKLTSSGIQDRSDDNENVSLIDTNSNPDPEDRSFGFYLPQTRSQSLENFKLRKRLMNGDADGGIEEQVEGKQLFSNHAVVYRVRQMYEHPDDDEFMEQESRPTPFHFELKTPHPASFKRPKFPQLTQYRYPHTTRNIQDVIKYLTNNPETSKHGIKFTGVYVNPKKYELYPDVDEIVANSDRSEIPSGSEESEEESSEAAAHFSIANDDPFYRYKPKHPADVNLLAPADLRFAPSNMHRYNNYFEPVYHRPMMLMNRPPIPLESSVDHAGAYSANFGKKKAKPFSVMLDIYPITDLQEQPSKKTSRPRPPIRNSEEYQETRRPSAYIRGGRYFPTSHVAAAQPIPVVAVPAPQPGMSEEDEKKQMVFHLNLYPRRKNKLSRNDILERSEMMRPEERQQFVEQVISPLTTITKQLSVHSAIEESKNEDNDIPTNLPLTRHEESFIEMPNEKDPLDNEGMESAQKETPKNHQVNIEEIVTSTTKATEKMNDEVMAIPTTINVDTIEGFQKFAAGLMTSN